MEEMIDNDVEEQTGGTRIRTKERDFMMKPGAHEMVTPGTDDYPQDRVGSSEHASSSPRCMDNTVEELTLKNYDGEKLTIVGSSDHVERMKKRSAWQHLYQIGGGSKSASNALEDKDSNYFSELLDQSQSQQNDNSNAIMSNLSNKDKGIRTKILSKSGFSEFFVKTTLRGKGEIHKILAKAGELNHPKSDHADPPKSTPLDLAIQSLPLLPSVSEPHPLVDYNINNIGDGISLREWLGGSRNKVESLRIFRLVLDFVDLSHSNGVPLQDLSPSFFKLLGSLQLIYIGSHVHVKVMENVAEQDIRYSNRNRNEKRHVNPSMLTVDEKSFKKRNSGENMNISRRWTQFPSRSGGRTTSSAHVDDVDEKPETKNQSKFFGQSMHNPSQGFESYTLEEKWYSCPELFKEKCCTFASNIYCLGILLFELLASFDSGRSHAAAMQDLRHRILPPRFLSENPKEAGFCLWLLHPEPSLRPSTSEILQSEFISGVQELPGNTLSSSMDDEEKEEKSELLLYFLLALNDQKQKSAANLVEQINRIETDIQEIEKRRPEKLLDLMHGHKETRLTGNIGQLESAYFSTRSNVQTSDVDKSTIRNIDLLKNREKMLSTAKEEYSDVPVDHLGGFYDGLCKYARYKKFKVRGILRNGEFTNSNANVICSLSFDRDENYLAAGGVSKKIKIYEFQALFNDSVDVHYPAVEMANKSKLNCICWNGYIRNYLASTDYDGIVKLWDASTGQGFCNLSEHSARAWSVDFSRVDPIKLASASDDRLVKVWSINDKNSLCTIRNNANICSVQFSNESSHMLAFSSADYKVYCYDLRNASIPWCVLAGHEKAVSYAKFLDGGTVVSASTDNTLKIWDLSKTSSNSLSRDACAVTLKGHTNEKNFVGLSVADGYITCGSETNEVYAYYKSLPMPITAHKFGSIDPTTGKETQDDNGQFVSSVCWRKKSNMVVAANSSGCIKLLEMV